MEIYTVTVLTNVTTGVNGFAPFTTEACSPDDALTAALIHYGVMNSGDEFKATVTYGTPLTTVTVTHRTLPTIPE